MLGHDAVASLDIAPNQAQARATLSVHRDHHVCHNPVCIAFLHRAEAAAALRAGREFYFRGILDRQNMTPGDSLAGARAPAFDDLRRRHLRVGEEPARLLLATTVTTQPAQAYSFARDHPFEDRAPLYRGADPR